MRALVVDVADIRNRPAARRAEHIEAVLDGLALTGSAVPAGAGVVVEVMLESVKEGILATGTVAAPWTGPCRRCLKPVAGDARAAVAELFEERATEGESYPLVHDQVDLEPLAREAVLLELPQAPLCRDDCRGLCATCGADLNEGPCGCVPDDRDPRWAALDALRPD